MKFLQILSLVSLLVSWLEEASEDGEITLEEVTDLVQKAVLQIGLGNNIKIKL